MPRDFVPCIYREQVLESPLTGVAVLSADVIELFEFSRLERQERDTRMSLNSHQFTLRHACTVAFDDVPDWPEGMIQERLRGPLFAHFYAAMAELE